MRQSNIELLRVFAILGVLLEHIVIFSLNPSGFEVAGEYNYISYQAACACVSLAIISVNLFVLISGYFSIKLSLKKVVSLFVCCTFYSFLVQIANYSMDGVWGIKNVCYIFMGLEDGWFMPTYLTLMCLAPMLNSFLKKADKKQLVVLWLFMLFVNVYLGYVRGKLGNENGFSILNFIFLYITGNMLREFDFSFKRSIIICSYLAATSIIFAMSMYKGGYFAFSYNNPFVLISSIAVFCYFTQYVHFSSTIVNRIATLAFPIFLTNPAFVGFLSRYWGGAIRNVYSMDNFVSISAVFVRDDKKKVFCG